MLIIIHRYVWVLIWFCNLGRHEGLQVIGPTSLRMNKFYILWYIMWSNVLINGKSYNIDCSINNAEIFQD